MLSIKMITFCKNANCPASQDLLAFQNGKTKNKQSVAITRHLKSCEFCATELEFYANFPQTDEKVACGQIPPPLFDLAEALLNNRHKESSLLNKLLIEPEPATAAEQV